MAGATSRLYKPPGSRLRAVNLDPLEAIGLPSKGDNRLLDFETQEKYHGKIVDRYGHLGNKLGHSESIDEALASLSFDGTSETRFPNFENNAPWRTFPDETFHKSSSGSEELSTILIAMRKLREAIVASARTDDFALRSYVFIIRATILEMQMESYQPALLHLLQKIHPVNPLPASEYQEFVGYYLLDLAIRQNDLAAAYEAKHRYYYKDAKVESVLKALVRGDWNTFWKTEMVTDKYQRQLMKRGDERMRKHAMNCVGKSYLNLDKDSLEKAFNQQWEELEGKSKVGWQLEGNVVTIRKIKGK